MRATPVGLRRSFLGGISRPGSAPRMPIVVKPFPAGETHGKGWHIPSGAPCTVDEVQERPPRRSEEDYLKRVEELAKVVCDEASEEGWLTYLPDDDDQTPLQRAINELARNLRHVHYEGDGCLDEDVNE